MQKTLYSTKYQRLLKWLKNSRIEKGFSMRSLADELHVPHSFVGKVEQGERRLDIVEYMTYCKALGVDPVEGLNILK